MYINPNSIPCQYMQGFYVHPDYPGYSVDCNGNVFSYHSKRMINGNVDLNGYKRFIYCDGRGNERKIRVHRLVAYHFVPLPSEFENDYSKATIDHLDANKLNNHYSNLEWVTLEENVKRAWKGGLCDPNVIANSRPVVIVDKVTKGIMNFPSIAEAASSLNVNRSSIMNHFVRKNSNYLSNRYICGYQDDPEFTSKLTDIDAMIKHADSNAWKVKPVVVLDKITKQLYSFPTIAEAERTLNINIGTMSAYLRRNSIGYLLDRYICGYQDDQDFISRLSDINAIIDCAEINTIRSRGVIILDKITRKIMSFPNGAEAEKALKLNTGTVSCYFHRNSMGYILDRYICGYQDDLEFTSRLNDIDDIIKEAESNTSRPKQVICNDLLTGIFIEYPTIADCSKAIGVKASTIASHLLRGSRTPIHKRWTILYKE